MTMWTVWYNCKDNDIDGDQSFNAGTLYFKTQLPLRDLFHLPISLHLFFFFFYKLALDCIWSLDSKIIKIDQLCITTN